MQVDHTIFGVILPAITIILISLVFIFHWKYLNRRKKINYSIIAGLSGLVMFMTLNNFNLHGIVIVKGVLAMLFIYETWIVKDFKFEK